MPWLLPLDLIVTLERQMALTSSGHKHFLWLSWAASIDLPWNLWSPSAPSPGSCTFKGINLTPHKYYVLFLHFVAQNWFILEHSFRAECNITHLQLAFALWITHQAALHPGMSLQENNNTSFSCSHHDNPSWNLPSDFFHSKKVDFTNSLPFLFSQLVLFSPAILTLTQEYHFWSPKTKVTCYQSLKKQVNPLILLNNWLYS